MEETIRLIQAFQFVAKHGEVCPAGWKPGAFCLRSCMMEGWMDGRMDGSIFTHQPLTRRTQTPQTQGTSR